MKESTKRHIISLLKEANSEIELRAMFQMVTEIALWERWDDLGYREIMDKYYDLLEGFKK